MRGPLRSACRAQALLVGCPVAPAHPGRSLGARPRVDDLRVQPAVAVDVGHVGLERTVAVLVVVGLVDQTVAVVVVADEVRASVVVHVRDDVDAAVGATDHCVLVPVPVTVDVDVRVVARRRRWRRRGEPAGGIPRLRQVASQQPALGADPAHRRADVAGNVAHPRLCRGTHAADSGLAETELGPVAEPHLARPTEAGLARVPRTLADALADRARVEPLAVAAEAAAATRAAVGRRPETGAARQGRQQSEQARLAGALLHMAIAARTGVELRVQQLDLVGREPASASAGSAARAARNPGSATSRSSTASKSLIASPHHSFSASQSSSGIGTGCGRGRHVPHCTSSSTTSPSARLRASLRCTSRRYGPNLAWSSHSPRPQNRHSPRAALAQNQHNTLCAPCCCCCDSDLADVEADRERLAEGGRIPGSIGCSHHHSDRPALVVTLRPRHRELTEEEPVGVAQLRGSLRAIRVQLPDRDHADRLWAVWRIDNVGVHRLGHIRHGLPGAPTSTRWNLSDLGWRVPDGLGDSSGDEDGDGDPPMTGSSAPSPHVSAAPVDVSGTPLNRASPVDSSVPPVVTAYRAGPSLAVSPAGLTTDRASGRNAGEAAWVATSNRPRVRSSLPLGRTGRPESLNSSPTRRSVPAHRTPSNPPRNVRCAVDLVATVTRSFWLMYTLSPLRSSTVDPSTTALTLPRVTSSSARSVGISAHAGPGSRFDPVNSNANSSSRMSSHHMRRSNRRSVSSSDAAGGGPGGAASGGYPLGGCTPKGGARPGSADDPKARPPSSSGRPATAGSAHARAGVRAMATAPGSSSPTGPIMEPRRSSTPSAMVTTPEEMTTASAGPGSMSGAWGGSASGRARVIRPSLSSRDSPASAGVSPSNASRSARSAGAGGVAGPTALATAAAGTASSVVPAVCQASAAGAPVSAFARPTTPPAPTRSRTVPVGSPGRRASSAPSTTTYTSGCAPPANTSCSPVRGRTQRAWAASAVSAAGCTPARADERSAASRRGASASTRRSDTRSRSRRQRRASQPNRMYTSGAASPAITATSSNRASQPARHKPMTSPATRSV